tara:strand:- start:1439 stop:1741 length:303 start_codon:yes stop_codon:yes gene_type:complete
VTTIIKRSAILLRRDKLIIPVSRSWPEYPTIPPPGAWGQIQRSHPAGEQEQLRLHQVLGDIIRLRPGSPSCASLLRNLSSSSRISCVNSLRFAESLPWLP